MSVDRSPSAVTARLRAATRGVSLRPEDRLRTKVDMSRAAVSARLRAVDQALALCRRLATRR